MKLELKCGPGDGEMFMLGKKRHDEGEVFGRRVPLRDINNPSMNTRSQFHSNFLIQYCSTSPYKNRVLYQRFLLKVLSCISRMPAEDTIVYIYTLV